MDRDLQVRLRAFQWLKEVVARHGEVVPWAVLLAGFSFEGERVPVVSQQGIFKPRLCRLPLSIRTSPKGPYTDSISDGGMVLYAYRGTDPQHRDNVGLRQTIGEGLPLIYLFGHVPGRYHVIWPVFVVGDDPAALRFTIAADDPGTLQPSLVNSAIGGAAEPRRDYVTDTVKRRLHQHNFRERVLQAYHDTCALCRLRHRELLDAAHIVPDSEPGGEPQVSNGLSLCKLHHAAFDRYFLTVDPDYRIVVREDVRKERDGPMLKHGLQELHRQKIIMPRASALRPSRDLLQWRLERFQASAEE